MILMHQNTPVAKIEMNEKIPVGYKEIIKPEELPLGTYHANQSTTRLLLLRWYESRSIPSARPSLKKIENMLGKNKAELFMLASGVSITDGYWFKDENDNVSWEMINYHDNGFDELLLQLNLNQLISGIHSPDITTDGVMEKFWHQAHGIPYLAKIDTIHENVLSANEVVYSNIAALSDVNVTPYTYGRLANIEYCDCPCFIQNAKEDFILAVQVKHENMQLYGEKLLYHFMKMGFEKEIQQMVTLDCIFHNTDRHEKNFGYIKKECNEYQFAPLYDNGCCLGINNDTSFIRDKDMKLLQNKRRDILEQFGLALNIDKRYSFSELERIYNLFSIPENLYEKAKKELNAGFDIYEQYLTKNKFFSPNYNIGEMEKE